MSYRFVTALHFCCSGYATVPPQYNRFSRWGDATVFLDNSLSIASQHCWRSHVWIWFTAQGLGARYEGSGYWGHPYASSWCSCGFVCHFQSNVHYPCPCKSKIVDPLKQMWCKFCECNERTSGGKEATVTTKKRKSPSHLKQDWINLLFFIPTLCLTLVPFIHQLTWKNIVYFN